MFFLEGYFHRTPQNKCCVFFLSTLLILFYFSSSRKVIWDLIIGLLIIYSTLTVPFRIGFDIETNPCSDFIDLLIDFCFIVDIVISFRTAYFDEVR